MCCLIICINSRAKHSSCCHMCHFEKVNKQYSNHKLNALNDITITPPWCYHRGTYMSFQSLNQGWPYEGLDWVYCIHCLLWDMKCLCRSRAILVWLVLCNWASYHYELSHCVCNIYEGLDSVYCIHYLPWDIKWLCHSMSILVWIVLCNWAIVVGYHPVYAIYHQQMVGTNRL